MVNMFVVMTNKLTWARWFNLTPVHITFVIEKVALGRVFL